jgi:hypothetical protein
MDKEHRRIILWFRVIEVRSNTQGLEDICQILARIYCAFADMMHAFSIAKELNVKFVELRRIVSQAWIINRLRASNSGTRFHQSVNRTQHRERHVFGTLALRLASARATPRCPETGSSTRRLCTLVEVEDAEGVGWITWLPGMLGGWGAVGHSVRRLPQANSADSTPSGGAFRGDVPRGLWRRGGRRGGRVIRPGCGQGNQAFRLIDDHQSVLRANLGTLPKASP